MSRVRLLVTASMLMGLMLVSTAQAQSQLRGASVRADIVSIKLRSFQWTNYSLYSASTVTGYRSSVPATLDSQGRFVLQTKGKRFDLGSVGTNSLNAFGINPVEKLVATYDWRGKIDKSNGSVKLLAPFGVQTSGKYRGFGPDYEGDGPPVRPTKWGDAYGQTICQRGGDSNPVLATLTSDSLADPAGNAGAVSGSAYSGGEFTAVSNSLRIPSFTETSQLRPRNCVNWSLSNRLNLENLFFLDVMHGYINSGSGRPNPATSPATSGNNELSLTIKFGGRLAR